MAISRREFLAGAGFSLASTGTAPRHELGLVIHSFPVRIEREKAQGIKPGLSDPFRMLEHALKLGASAIQVGLGPLEDAKADALRASTEAAGIGLEGIVSLPREASDLARLAAEVKAAKRAGALILRTVLLSGRRYETFRTRAAFLEHMSRATEGLKLAEKLAREHGVRLAVENHKDLRAEEQVKLIKSLASDHVGICLDTGNNMALLEEPHEAVEILAPWAVTTHLKDMATEPDKDGFLLSEVPLGQGTLDLPRMVKTLRKANPSVRLNLEMITRDPLRIPCLTEDYARTFEKPPQKEAAKAIERVNRAARNSPLPRPSRSDGAGRLKIEDENIRISLEYADRFLKG